MSAENSLSLGCLHHDSHTAVCGFAHCSLTSPTYTPPTGATMKNALLEKVGFRPPAVSPMVALEVRHLCLGTFTDARIFSVADLHT